MLIAWCVTGSFCTIGRVCEAMEHISMSGAHTIIPILSPIVEQTDTRFGSAFEVKARIEGITGRNHLSSVVETEPFGPFHPPDIVIVAPCTGNTLAKIAAGITDNGVTMTVKAQLRSDKPVLLAVCSNDALSSNMANIAAMLNRKSVYIAPVIQDDPIHKPHSAVTDFNLLEKAVAAAVDGRQLYPVFMCV